MLCSTPTFPRDKAGGQLLCSYLVLRCLLSDVGLQSGHRFLVSQLTSPPSTTVFRRLKNPPFFPPLFVRFSTKGVCVCVCRK